MLIVLSVNRAVRRTKTMTSGMIVSHANEVMVFGRYELTSCDFT